MTLIPVGNADFRRFVMFILMLLQIVHSSCILRVNLCFICVICVQFLNTNYAEFSYCSFLTSNLLEIVCI